MLEESADVVPNGEAAGAVAGVGVAPKGPPAVDPNTDVEDCCGADVVAVDVPNIDDPAGLKTEEEALEEPKGEEAVGAVPKLLLAPKIEEP